MICSQFALKPAGNGVRYRVPEQVGEDRALLAEQCQTTLRLLRHLNLATCGEPVGPFQWLAVFNSDENET